MELREKLELLASAPEKLSWHQTNEIIELSISAASSYLRGNINKINRYLTEDGIEVIDIAIDAAATLFAKDDDGKFKYIEKAYCGWKEKIKNDKDAEYFLFKISINIAAQHLIKYLKEKDPLYSKYISTMAYNAEKNNLTKKTLWGTVYLIKKGISRNGLNLITEEDFNSIPADILLDKRKYLPRLLDYLQINGYSPAIPINILIKRLKEIGHNNYARQELAPPLNEVIEIDELTRNALYSAVKKLKISYLNKKKITAAEFELFRIILSDIISDLSRGGAAKGLYEYFENRDKTITKEEYCQKYQSIIEYFIKLIKEDLANKLNISPKK